MQQLIVVFHQLPSSDAGHSKIRMPDNHFSYQTDHQEGLRLVLSKVLNAMENWFL